MVTTLLLGEPVPHGVKSLHVIANIVDVGDFTIQSYDPENAIPNEHFDDLLCEVGSMLAA